MKEKLKSNTRASKNRAIRQEELRNKLAAGGHLQQVLKNITEIRKVRPGKNAAFKINKLKIATDLQLRLVNKYLPDLKSTELTGEGGGDIKVNRVTYKDA